MIVLLNTKKLDKNISNFIEVITELSIQPALKFRGQFPYLGKAQDIRLIPWVESQSDYHKFNIQCLVFNKNIYPPPAFHAVVPLNYILFITD